MVQQMEIIRKWCTFVVVAVWLTLLMGLFLVEFNVNPLAWHLIPVSSFIPHIHHIIFQMIIQVPPFFLLYTIYLYFYMFVIENINVTTVNIKYERKIPFRDYLIMIPPMLYVYVKVTKYIK